jgi:hypothetical protein
LFYYEYEYHVQNLIDILKEKQEAENGKGSESNQMDANSMMRNAQKGMPKMTMPKFPSIPSSLKL